MKPLVIGPDRDGRWALVEGHRLAELGGPGDEPPAGAARLAADGARLEPGRVNAHTHLYSGLVPLGLPPPSPPPEGFVQILERLWWRLDRALDAEALRASARLYVAEALLAGTTTLVDHHESPELIEGSLDILADACDALGVRAVLCYGATERNGGTVEAQRGLDECARLVRVLEARGRIAGAVGLHASFTVSDETVRRAGELARALGTVVHVHVAEGAADVQDAQRRGYRGPLERLDELGALVPGSILAHGVHLDESEVRVAAERGCWLVHNPRSNRNNGVGWAGALGASDRVALGTDGFPADMPAERHALAEQATERGEPADEAQARFDAGRRLVAERFGRAFELVAGAAADLVVAGEAGVRHVLVDGHVVVRDGRLGGADLETIRAEAKEQAARLGERMTSLEG